MRRDVALEPGRCRYAALGERRRSAGGLALLLALSLVGSGASALVAVCPADCDGDDVVAVDELVRAVASALGEVSIEECPAVDRDCSDSSTVDELLSGVHAALFGCGEPRRGTLVRSATAGQGLLSDPTADPMLGGRPRLPPQFAVVAPSEASVTTFVSNLRVPWAMQFAPDGRLFVSERAGRIRVVVDGVLQEEPWLSLPVTAVDESGLMGLALHPRFKAEPFVYACYTYEREDGELVNRVVRIREEAGRGGDAVVLVDGIIGGTNHDGCRLKFGPDEKLYVTTGDGWVRERAQDLGRLEGKILRLNPDGSAPTDNPFAEAPLVWSYGHRNPQGLAFQPGSGRLYESEHGPSGEVGVGAYDEINVIDAGANYGWPRAVGAPHVVSYRDPLFTVVPPEERAVPLAGMTFYGADTISEWRGDLFVASLGATQLLRFGFDACGRMATIERLYSGTYGRLRDVIEGPDGALYVSTSNRDGRGRPTADDDRILRIRASPR